MSLQAEEDVQMSSEMKPELGCAKMNLLLRERHRAESLP